MIRAADLGFLFALRAAGIAGVLAVVIGAFGGHLLEDFLVRRGGEAELIERRTAQFETGVRYHLAHAVGLLALAALGRGVTADDPLRSRLGLAAVMMLAGILLFSGSLYLLVLTGYTWLGMITPLGGLSWIVAWAALIAAAGQSTSRLG